MAERALFRPVVEDVVVEQESAGYLEPPPGEGWVLVEWRPVESIEQERGRRVIVHCARWRRYSAPPGFRVGSTVPDHDRPCLLLVKRCDEDPPMLLVARYVAWKRSWVCEWSGYQIEAPNDDPGAGQEPLCLGGLVLAWAPADELEARLVAV